MFLSICSVSYPSPSNLQLIGVAPQRLTFSWNSVAPNCAAIHYNIFAQDCGICPGTTSHNTVVCHDMEIIGKVICSFAVQIVRSCDGAVGNTSNSIQVMLKGISAKRTHTFTVKECSASFNTPAL